MKDPAALLYIDKYLVATSEMSADCVGWYTKLILHQYDKGSLPNDLETLASLCNVRFSEFERFKHVFEQVLKQRFKQNEAGRLENDFAKEILTKRQNFKEKRSKSGILGVFAKIAKYELGADNDQIEFLKSELKKIDFENIQEGERKQMLKHLLKLYINVNEDVIKKEKVNKTAVAKIKKLEIIYPFDSEEFKTQWQLWKTYKHKQHGFKYKTVVTEQAALKELAELADTEEKAIKIIHQSIAQGWKGFFELKNETKNGNNTSNPFQRANDIVDKFYSGNQ